VSHVFYIKTGDTAPSIEATLSIEGEAINLTNATGVKFKVPGLGIDAAATVVTAAAGIVRYDWGATDADVAGVFDAEFEITWTGGGVQTVPNKGYIKVYVTEDLD
jgi:hypothetical protein